MQAQGKTFKITTDECSLPCFTKKMGRDGKPIYFNGTQTVTVETCTKQNNINVTGSECADYEKKFFTVPCKNLAACPGNNKYGKWSDWGPCTRTCLTGDEIATKTRERSCEGRQCAGTCHNGRTGAPHTHVLVIIQ